MEAAFLHKIPKINLDKLIDSIHYLNKEKIDYRGSKYLDVTDILISSAQSGVNTGKKIKEIKSKLERAEKNSLSTEK